MTHFQATTEGPSVPHPICRRTEVTLTTARRCFGVAHKTLDLHIYLHQINATIVATLEDRSSVGLISAVDKLLV